MTEKDIIKIEGKIEEIKFLIVMYQNTKERCKTAIISKSMECVILDLKDRLIYHENELKNQTIKTQPK